MCSIEWSVRKHLSSASENNADITITPSPLRLLQLHCYLLQLLLVQQDKQRSLWNYWMSSSSSKSMKLNVVVIFLFYAYTRLNYPYQIISWIIWHWLAKAAWHKHFGSLMLSTLKLFKSLQEKMNCNQISESKQQRHVISAYSTESAIYVGWYNIKNELASEWGPYFVFLFWNYSTD